MADKVRISKKEQEELQRLYENSKSGMDDDIDAFELYADSLGIEPDEVREYLSVKIEPESMYEKRQEMKGKPADLRKGTEAIGIKDIASAYGVDLDLAEKEGDLEKGKLQSYLDSRYVMRPHPNESRDEYVQRNINAFEKLGLNWYNQEDRKRVFDSMEVAERLDAREGIAEEATSGPMGLLRQLVFPRTTERAVKYILEGEDEGGLGKDIALDIAENTLQSLVAPATGGFAFTGKGLRAAKAAKAAQKAAQTAEKAEGAMTAAERAKKAGKGLKTLAGIGGDAAAVPLLMEIADAAAYDEEESPRGEFSPEDVIVGTAVNAITPMMLYRYGSKGSRMLGEDASKAEKAVEDIKKAVDIRDLGGSVANRKLGRVIEEAQELADAGKLRAYATNKAGRSESVRSLPFVSSLAESQQKEAESREKRERTRREKESKWSKGLSIPWPGDRDYEDYIKFKERVTERMMLRDYVE